MSKNKITPNVGSSLARSIISSPFLLACILLTLAAWIILIFQIPLFQKLPHWFWPLRRLASPQYWWIIPILLINFGALAFVGKFPDKAIRNILILILIGYVTQHMFALIEGRGLDGIRDRMVYSGHADFAYDAADHPSLTRVMRDYRAMIDSGELRIYPHSTKPPGHFLVYILTSRLARLFPWLGPVSFERLATLAAFLYPLLTYLPLIPLFYLANQYLSRAHAYLALFLFMAAPNLILMTLHLDQSLYPLLFITPITLYLYGCQRQKATLSLLSGLAIAVACYISFSLIAIIAVMGLMGFLFVWKKDGGLIQNLQDEIKNLALVGVGFLTFELIMFILFRYNILGDYSYVMSQHQAWKVEEWTAWFILYIGGLDILEFALWIGVPLFLFGTAWMLKSLLRWRQDEPAVLAVSLLISLLLLAFFGKTVAETGRLWLFLVPVFALFAIQELVERYPNSYKQTFSLILGLQLLSTYILKLFQDFY